VQTADERILPQGTGYITDVGMTGGQDSVIGVKPKPAIDSFLTGVHQRLEPSLKNLALNGVVLTVREETGKCESIRRVSEVLGDGES
jgi:calcineurin-like phosphoesterase